LEATRLVPSNTPTAWPWRRTSSTPIRRGRSTCATNSPRSGGNDTSIRARAPSTPTSSTTRSPRLTVGAPWRSAKPASQPSRRPAATVTVRTGRDVSQRRCLRSRNPPLPALGGAARVPGAPATTRAVVALRRCHATGPRPPAYSCAAWPRSLTSSPPVPWCVGTATSSAARSGRPRTRWMSASACRASSPSSGCPAPRSDSRCAGRSGDSTPAVCPARALYLHSPRQDNLTRPDKLDLHRESVHAHPAPSAALEEPRGPAVETAKEDPVTAAPGPRSVWPARRRRSYPR